MGALLQDIPQQSDWLIKGFKADGLRLDYSIESFQKLEQFYDMHVKDGMAVPGGRFDQRQGILLFSIGAYMGETFIKQVPRTVWRTGDNDPDGEVNAAIIFPDGTQAWPIQRAIKRFYLGQEENLYVYGKVLLGTQDAQAIIQPGSKRWWKFW